MRVYEVLFIVSILIICIYFISYKTAFKHICENNTGENWLTEYQTLKKMWSCTDSIVCSINNIKYDELHRNVTDWKCEKNTVNVFEANFYSNKFYNFKNQIFK